MKTKQASLLKTALVTSVSGMLFAATNIAMAGGPLNLNPLDPDGIERYGSGGANIPFNVDPGPCTPLASPQADIVSAFAAWSGIASATSTHSNNGPLPFDIDGTNFAPFLDSVIFGGGAIADNFSPVIFDEDGGIFAALGFPGGVLGVATPAVFAANGDIIESETIIGCATGFPDLFGVVVHELGHYQGHGHTQVNGSIFVDGDTTGPTPDNTTFGPLASSAGNIETMYPFAIIGGGEDTPHADDIAYHSFMYPAGNFISSTGTISGTVLAGNGTTPLTGINVIARNLADPFDDAVSAISGDRGTTGDFTLNNLTPGETYAVFIDNIGSGGFSTTGSNTPVEEFWNGVNESADGAIDDPLEFVGIDAVAGSNIGGINFILNSIQPGSEIPLGDDTSFELPLPFSFKTCGQSFDSVFVNSNGNLTFGAGDGDFTESPGEFLDGPPRIAPLWTDLSPNNGGTVTFDQTATSLTVSFIGVPSFPAVGATSFDVTIFAGPPSPAFGGKVKVDYGDSTEPTGLAGETCGLFATNGSEPARDLSAAFLGRIRMARSTAEYELFTFASPNDLQNSTLNYTETRDFFDSFEGNNSQASATPVTLPFKSGDNVVTNFTEISPAGGDVDYYSFNGNAGDSILATVSRGQMDSVLGIFDSAGTLLALDDDSGSGFLSALAITLPANDTYSVAVSTFPDFDFDGDGNTDPFFGTGAYTLDISTTICPTSGLDIPLAGDGSAEVSGFGFDFPFNGTDYSSIFINANGNITFGSGDSDFSPSVSELLSDQPRVAGTWDDFEPDDGGNVWFNTNGTDSLNVSWDRVPTFVGGTDSNSFCITLNGDGSIKVDGESYAALVGNQFGEGAIVGVSEGGGAADPGPTDLSAGGPFPAAGTTYELFPGGIDLAGESVEFTNGGGGGSPSLPTPRRRR